MKKSVLLATFAIAAIVVTSCKKEEVNVTGPSLTVSLEAMDLEDNDAKTIYNPTTGQFLWKRSDKVRVYDNTFRSIVYVDEQASASYNYSTHQYSGSSNIHNLVVSTDPVDFGGCMSLNDESDYFYAFYPSYYVNHTSNGFEYNIPAKQLIDNNLNVDKIDEMHLTRFPMARRTTGNNFKMMNLCGGLKLTLQKSGVKVKSIQFRTLGNQQVSGTFTVTFSDVVSDNNTEYGVPSLNPVASNINYSTRATTLELNEPVSIDNARDFYIALPPATYANGFEIIITDENNNIANIKTTRSATVTRNKINRLNISSTLLDNLGGFHEGHGKFSINPDGDQVYIAPGNLQWNNGNWQFANEQYEVMTLGCDGQYDPDAYNWDLFHFSLQKKSVSFLIDTSGHNHWQTGELIIDYIGYHNPWTQTGWYFTGANNDFGKSNNGADYQITRPSLTYVGNPPVLTANNAEIPVYRNWGLAFGENSKWMVLDGSEYMHMFVSRIANSQCHCHINGNVASFTHVVIDGDDGIKHPGILIFPDNWVNGYTDETIHQQITWNAHWVLNQHDQQGWWSLAQQYPMSIDIYRILEAAGCAFFPCTGSAKNLTLPVTLNGAACLTQSTSNARCYYWTREIDNNQSLSQYDPEGIDLNSTIKIFTDENRSIQLQNDNPNTYAAVRLFMRVPTSSTNN